MYSFAFIPLVVSVQHSNYTEWVPPNATISPNHEAEH